MNRVVLIALLVGSGLLIPEIVAFPQESDTLPAVDDVTDAYVRALGGKMQIESIETWSVLIELQNKSHFPFLCL